ncbi:P-loop containing nucleoside triphosphate hydrolase protein, partial [Pavlovales sp. CCMP2436]
MYRGGGGRGWRGAPQGGGSFTFTPRGGGGRGPSRGGFSNSYKRPHPGGAGGAAPNVWKRVKAEDGPALPVLARRGALLGAVREHAVIVVSGETGCGKSTQVPQFLLDDDATATIACTQPRRIATKTLAERVSRERAKPLGQEVGYAVSREQAVTRGETRCTFLTVGLLLQSLIFERRKPRPAAAADGQAGGQGDERALGLNLPYSHIVVDEAHERSCDMDLLLLLLRRIMHEQADREAAEAEAEEAALAAATTVAAIGGPAAMHADGSAGAPADAASEGAPTAEPLAAVRRRRRRLTVIIMSATADVKRLLEYFATPPTATVVDAVSGLAVRIERPLLHVPHLHVGGSLHPVCVAYLDDLLGTSLHLLPADQRAAAQRELQASMPALLAPGAPPKAVRVHPQLWSLVAFVLRHLPLLAPSLCATVAVREVAAEVVARAKAVGAAVRAGGGGGSGEGKGALPAADEQPQQPPSEEKPLGLSGAAAVALAGLPPLGAVLVFLPGVAEISELMRALNSAAAAAEGEEGGLAGCGAQLQLVPLHGLLEPAEQAAALAPAPRGMRKVVLTTNVGESSITVPDVAFVVDLGLEKLPFFDSRANMEALLLSRCSKASAKQRAGRCGRLGPGLCLRLFAKALCDAEEAPADGEGAAGSLGVGWQSGRMLEFTVPEMQRTSLANLVLKVKLMQPGASAAQVLAEALEPPEVAALTSATAELVALGTLAAGGRVVTPLGALVAALPCSAQMGRLCVLGEALGLGRQSAVLAAALSLPDIFLQPFRAPAPTPPPPTDDADSAAAAAATAAAVQLADWQFAAADVGAYRRRLELFAQS